jgi:hypothetical protein
MLRRVTLVRTDVSEEPSASFIGVTSIGELGTTLAVTSNRRTQRNVPEDDILHSHRRENLTSYRAFVCIVSFDSVQNKTNSVALSLRADYTD